ncbi:PREDICTED: uncharacterized exonuclease domain-containing protein At3g15140 isoform X2 [Ipomoea nil]|uniref:uncharacterized exonuclease domain-containing protein At3g15140 isoform X2 n=1 Tax=Ipomoea nil TaxID=35883 RepID=UPI000901904C|nr:PREDICTED: uncharacterized exonuclease domain-containing protein At3g15140 isoform X2 [Ipomoea nil]
MALSRVTVFSRNPVRSPPLPFTYSSPFSLCIQRNRQIGAFAVHSMAEESASSPIAAAPPPKNTRWRPTCLYFTQGKCTKMDDAIHIERFNHSCSVSGEMTANALQSRNLQQQGLEFLLVLDLEGKVEILEFPVLLFDTKTMDVIDFFHRVWHDTAIPFKEVIQEFETWLVKNELWRKERGGCLSKAAFVTCGNWDLKTKVPQQCEVAKMKLPPYFMEWINLKDIYLNFYKRRAPGMLSMMRELKIPLLGSHHLGIDDSKNIARVLQHMLNDGAYLQVTARRNPDSPEVVKFLFENRIR